MVLRSSMLTSDMKYSQWWLSEGAQD
jgi:hypothetical protein